MVAEHVYVISCPQAVKIGIANNPRARLKALQTANHQRLSLHYSVECDEGQAYSVEQYAHSLLKEKRIKGEWFSVAAEQAVDAVESALESLRSGHIAANTGRKSHDRLNERFLSSLTCEPLQASDVRIAYFLLWISTTQNSLDGSRWVAPLGALTELCPEVSEASVLDDVISRIFYLWFNYGDMHIPSGSQFGLYPMAKIILEFCLCRDEGWLKFMPSAEIEECIKHVGLEAVIAHLEKHSTKQKDAAA